MRKQYDSKAEASAANIIAELGGIRCSDFAPHLPTSYLDAADVELEGRPDFVVHRASGPIFIELKAGDLNFHRTRENSHDALIAAYAETFHRFGGNLTHGQLSSALYGHSSRGEQLVRENAFNHSVFKLAAQQAKLGWTNFIVVFKKNPSKKLATRYLQAGLVFCTQATLKEMLFTIELNRHGILVPFRFKTRTYSYTVVGDPATLYAAPAEVELLNRAKFLAGVAADIEGERAMLAQDAANLAAGIMPF
jgi:hypothetical protein